MTVTNRNEELDTPETALESPSHDFHVVYERRRVEKTALRLRL